MKKTVDVMVCDVCGEDENRDRSRFIVNCGLCGKDLCSKCMVSLNWIEDNKLGYGDVYSFRICPSHTKELLKKCKEI